MKRRPHGIFDVLECIGVFLIVNAGMALVWWSLVMMLPAPWVEAIRDAVGRVLGG